MNAYLRVLMDKPSITTPYCCVCGGPASENHHIVARSQGGKNGPTARLCGCGNTSGCHGLAHSGRLHFRYTDHWEVRVAGTATKYDRALEQEGWRSL